MEIVLTAAKFVLGATVLIFALLDVDSQPFMVILALLLMGVLGVDEFSDWFPGRRSNIEKENAEKRD